MVGILFKERVALTLHKRGRPRRVRRGSMSANSGISRNMAYSGYNGIDYAEKSTYHVCFLRLLARRYRQFQIHRSSYGALRIPPHAVPLFYPRLGPAANASIRPPKAN